MKNKIFVFIKKNWYHLLAFVLIAFLNLQYIFKNQSLLIFYGDSFEQQLLYQLGAWLRVHSLNFSLWDWTLGYGANYLSKIDNIVGSPFLYLSLMFKYEFLPYLAVYFYTLKLILIYVFSYRWLKKIQSNPLVSSMLSIILTFSGWVMFFYHYSYFLEGFMFFPLILSLIEDYLSKGKFKLLIAIITVLSIVNFYFSYMFLPFTILYFGLRLYGLNGRITLKRVGQFIGILILGVSMAAFVLVPLAHIILETPRLNGITANAFTLISKFDVYRYFSTFYSPVMERFDPSYFISTSYDKGIGWGGGVSLYSFILFPIMFPLVFTIQNKLKRSSILIGYGILIFLASFVFFYRLLQGTYDVRWFYMFTLLNIYTMSEIFESIEEFGLPKKTLVSSFFASSLILFLLLFISKHYHFYGIESHWRTLLNLVLFDIVLMFIYSYLIFKRNYNLLFIVVLIEAILSFSIPLNANPPIEADILKNELKTLMNRSAITSIQEEDQDFYRIIKDNQDYLNQNEPYAQNYPGISFYSSVYNFQQQAYLNRFNETYSIPVTMGRDNSFLMTSVKYFISESNNHTAPLGFKYWKTVDDSVIYKNEYFIPIGFIQSQSLNESLFLKQSYLNQDRLLLNHVILENSSNQNLNYINDLLTFGENIHTDHYYFSHPTLFKDSMIYIENNNISGVIIRSSSNTNFLRDDEYQQYFYQSKYFDKDSTVDAIEIFAPGALTSEEGYSIYIDTNLDYYKSWYSSLSSQFMTVDSWNSSQVTGQITVNQNNAWFVSTIPYDLGWKAYVDGQLVETSKVNLGFIGFPIDVGNHSIVFKYQTPYLREGIAISIFGILLYIILILRSKRQGSN